MGKSGSGKAPGAGRKTHSEVVSWRCQDAMQRTTAPILLCDSPALGDQPALHRKRETFVCRTVQGGQARECVWQDAAIRGFMFSQHSVPCRDMQTITQPIGHCESSRGKTPLNV
jgi:hypothetical protein